MDLMRIAARVAAVSDSDRSHWGRITYKVDDKEALAARKDEILSDLESDFSGMSIEDISIDTSRGFVNIVYHEALRVDSPSEKAARVLRQYDARVRSTMRAIESLYGIDMYALAPSSTPGL